MTNRFFFPLLCVLISTPVETKAQEFHKDSVMHTEQWYQTIQIGQHTWFKEDVRFLPEKFMPGTSDTVITNPRAAVPNVLTSNQNNAINSTQGNKTILYNFQAIQHGGHISSSRGSARNLQICLRC